MEEEKKEYLMPDYYNSFACKMGNCRRACCEGWPITFSIEDYFRLMTLDCSESLRRKIDSGVKVSLSPTPDVYAQVMMRYDGTCPMRLDDGRCSIHAEAGENSLSDVCRLYPRGLRIEPSEECSCSNSCEAVLELLFSKETPIEFLRSSINTPLPPLGKRGIVYPVFEYEQKIRLYLIKIIQNRSFSFPIRLILLGKKMKRLEEIIQLQDKKALEDWLTDTSFESDLVFDASKERLNFGIQIIEGLIDLIDKRSDNVREYGEKALEYFINSNNVSEAYITAKNHFETTFPLWEIYFEQMIVNHMFFEQFPFQDRPVSLWNEFLALSAVYSLLRFLSMGYMWNVTSFERLVDMYSATFRLVDHTSFDLYAAKTMKMLKCDTDEKIFSLISL